MENKANPTNNESIWKGKITALLVSIFIIAGNGVIYELLIAGYSSYLLGDSITQFSITIGIFMSSMGVGSWFTQKFEEDLIKRFVQVEIWLAVIGGPTVLILAMSHIYTRVYVWVMFLFIFMLGFLIGFEIPIVTRIVNQYGTLKEALANVLSFDYIGALVGSVAFPLLLLPELGFAKTSFFIGILNLCVAIFNLIVFRKEFEKQKKLYWGVTLTSGIFLVIGFLFSAQWIEQAREKASEQKTVLLTQSKYQTIRLVEDKIVGNQTVFRLYLNKEHQFSTHTEHRYHESLVHPILGLAPRRKKILLLGAGDGLALRELWKYKEIESITLVDLDPKVTWLGKNHPLFRKLNQNSLVHPKLKIVHMDAFLFVEKSKEIFDIAILDLPVPTNISLSKLYTRDFYRKLYHVISPDGLVVSEAANVDSLENKPFWCLILTQRSTKWKVIPYLDQTMGYTLLHKKPVDPSKLELKVPSRHLTTQYMRSLFALPKDIYPKEKIRINTLETHSLLQYILELRES